MKLEAGHHYMTRKPPAMNVTSNVPRFKDASALEIGTLTSELCGCMLSSVSEMANRFG